MGEAPGAGLCEPSRLDMRLRVRGGAGDTDKSRRLEKGRVEAGRERRLLRDDGRGLGACRRVWPTSRSLVFTLELHRGRFASAAEMGGGAGRRASGVGVVAR